jgi:hypothetical protein
MSTLLTSKPKVQQSRFDARDGALEGYLTKRSERSADTNHPQNAHDYSYDGIVARHRRRNDTTGAAAQDGLVVRKTTMRQQMKKEGRLGRDGRVRRGRAAPTRVVSRRASQDFEVPWDDTRRRRRRQPYTSAADAKGDGAYSSVSDMASQKLSAAAAYLGAAFGAPAPPAPARGRKPAAS